MDNLIFSGDTIIRTFNFLVLIILNILIFWTSFESYENRNAKPSVSAIVYCLEGFLRFLRIVVIFRIFGFFETFGIFGTFGTFWEFLALFGKDL